jgi:hypothetical protein
MSFKATKIITALFFLSFFFAIPLFLVLFFFFVKKIFFLEINQSETRMACGSHVCKRIATKLAIFIEDFPKMLPTKCRLIWPSGFRGEDF